MKSKVLLSEILQSAPSVPCLQYDVGDIATFSAHGAARNLFGLRVKNTAISLETDGACPHRFPPDITQLACDWCVFTVQSHRGYFIELKGSDYLHALNQLTSTMLHMKRTYSITPVKAFAVLSGSHPSNVSPGKANAKSKFQKKFGFLPDERRRRDSVRDVVV